MAVIDAIREGLSRMRWDCMTYILLAVLWITVSAKLDIIILELKKL